jgi:hypothetical protein
MIIINRFSNIRAYGINACGNVSKVNESSRVSSYLILVSEARGVHVTHLELRNSLIVNITAAGASAV